MAIVPAIAQLHLTPASRLARRPGCPITGYSMMLPCLPAAYTAPFSNSTRFSHARTPMHPMVHAHVCDRCLACTLSAVRRPRTKPTHTCH